MDKVILKFIADILYLKGTICYEEYDDILNVSTLSDLDAIVENILCSKYNGYTRGEIDA